MNKKIMLNLGFITLSAIPLATIVSCSNNSSIVGYLGGDPDGGTSINSVRFRKELSNDKKDWEVKYNGQEIKFRIEVSKEPGQPAMTFLYFDRVISSDGLSIKYQGNSVSLKWA